MSAAFSDACIQSFLVYDATRRRVPVSRKRFTRRDIVDMKNREMYPQTHSDKLSKNEMPGSSGVHLGNAR
jgi:hypothetical protein